MTTTIFMTILFIVTLIIFCTFSFSMMILFNNDTVGLISGTIATALFVVLFANITPSWEQMIENDYYAMMNDRPKCIDDRYVSLGCKKDYIYWQKDSIEKQHKYDSVKVKLENLQKEILK